MVSKMDIIRVPPSGGKTSLVKSEPGRFVDSDMLIAIMGFPASKEGVEALKESGSWDHDLICKIVGDRVLLTNFDPNWVSNNRYDYDVVNVRYNPEDYVAHIKASKRDDLLQNFSEEELAGWMNFEADYVLAEGSYIKDIIDLI